MSSKSYDIVLLPEAELAAKAIRTSEELAPLGTDYTLNTQDCLPHVSLYMLQLKQDSLEALEGKLTKIATETAHFSLEADGYVQAVGYIDVNYIRMPEIDTLHLAVVAAANPLRDGLRNETKEDLATLSGQAKENVEQYGDHRIGDLFRPHLTFARFSNRQPIPLEDMGAPTAFSGRYTRLALCELGPSGTCVRIVKAFPLS